MLAISNLGEYISSAVPEVCKYWIEKAGGRAAPTRNEVDVLEMPKSHLPRLLIVDIELEPFRVKYRLVGTHFSRQLAVDFTGKYLDQLVLPGTLRDEAIDLYRAVQRTGLPAVGHYGYPKQGGGQALTEFAILPISNGEIVTHCLAVEHYGVLDPAFADQLVKAWIQDGSSG
jgi:hypothetical protein